MSQHKDLLEFHVSHTELCHLHTWFLCNFGPALSPYVQPLVTTLEVLDVLTACLSQSPILLCPFSVLGVR